MKSICRVIQNFMEELHLESYLIFLDVYIWDQLPRNIVPSVDMIRSYLHEIPEPNVLYLKNDIPVTATDLRKYDEKCGVSK